MLDKDNFHDPVTWINSEGVQIRLKLFNVLQLMARSGKGSWQNKNAYSDLNYVGRKTLYASRINLPFTRSREVRGVENIYEPKSNL